MIDINQEFETSSMTDVAYCALQTFANQLELLFAVEVNMQNLNNTGFSRLLQLQYLYNKMSDKNFFTLSKKLNYNPALLDQAFHTIFVNDAFLTV